LNSKCSQKTLKLTIRLSAETTTTEMANNSRFKEGREVIEVADTEITLREIGIMIIMSKEDMIRRMSIDISIGNPTERKCMRRSHIHLNLRSQRVMMTK
jgi:hypothetical protein